jgi:membrane protein
MAADTSTCNARPRSPVTIVRRAIKAFIDHDVLTLAAALAFYTLLSFAPLMVMVLWATASLGPATRDAFLGQFAALAGEDARIAAQAILDNVSKHQHMGSVASVIGVVIVLFGATSVFAQLQTTLNKIWDIPPRKGSAIRGWLRRRIISAGVLLAIGFVLIASTMVSSLVGLVLSRSGPLWDVANQIIAMAIFGGLFAVLFRYVPDSWLSWRYALIGGFATAVLFGIGKWVIGASLARGNIAGAYGAAGSLVIVLVWTYYSATAFFFSAELLQAWVEAHGDVVAPCAKTDDPSECIDPKMAEQHPSGQQGKTRP